MGNHTPGPWTWGGGWEDPATFGDPEDELSGEKYADLRLLGAGGVEVVPLRIDHHDFLFDAERNREAIRPEDRRLIAAAPDLLEALRELIAAGQFCVDSDDDIKGMLRLGTATNAADAAIAKAEGR